MSDRFAYGTAVGQADRLSYRQDCEQADRDAYGFPNELPNTLRMRVFRGIKICGL